MESVISSISISEEVLSEYFCVTYGNTHFITNNRYFSFEKTSNSSKKDSNKPKNKAKISKLEWFDSLDIQQRVEAVSTVATGNVELLSWIKKDIKRIENKYKDRDDPEEQGFSNEEYLSNQRNYSVRSHYISNSSALRFGDEISPRFSRFIKTITFLDFKETEDTISVTEELVQNSAEFFENLEKTWKELSKNDSYDGKEEPINYE